MSDSYYSSSYARDLAERRHRDHLEHLLEQQREQFHVQTQQLRELLKIETMRMVRDEITRHMKQSLFLLWQFRDTVASHVDGIEQNSAQISLEQLRKMIEPVRVFVAGVNQLDPVFLDQVSEKDACFQLARNASSFTSRVNAALQSRNITNLAVAQLGQQVEPFLPLQRCDPEAYERDGRECQRLRRQLNSRRPRSRSDRTFIACSSTAGVALAWLAAITIHRSYERIDALLLLLTPVLIAVAGWAVWESVALFSGDETPAVKQWRNNRELTLRRLNDLNSAWEGTFSLNNYWDYVQVKPLIMFQNGEMLLRAEGVNALAEEIRRELLIVQSETRHIGQC